MKALDHLIGWCVLFVVACWAVIGAGNSLGSHPHAIDYFTAASGLTCGVLACLSIWRDRLA